MQMVCYLDQVLVCLSGHSYLAKAGEVVDIRPENVREALARGFTPVSTEEYKAFEAKPVIEPVIVPAGSDRAAAILAGMQEMRQANKRFDFTAAKFPQKAVLERKLGFELERGELESLWTQLTAKAA